MKKVLFISYFFPPSAGAAAKCTAPVAKYLREFGYEPIVLAPEPRTFVEDPLSLGVDPSCDAEIPRDVRVCRVPPCEPFELLRLLKKLKLLWVFHFFVAARRAAHLVAGGDRERARRGAGRERGPDLPEPGPLEHFAGGLRAEIGPAEAARV